MTTTARTAAPSVAGRVGSDQHELMHEYDVVVVGGGAAGLSAALVLSRARRRVAVVDAGAPRNAPAAHMHGFLSRDSFSPLELLEIGRQEVEGYGGLVIDGRVTGIVGESSPGPGTRFRVSLADGRSMSTRRVLVATGLRDELPDIPGVHDRWGRDLLHCPYCHGYEVRDQPLAVLGGTTDAVHHAQLLRQWSSDVVLLPHNGALTPEQRAQLAARGISVVDGPVGRLVVDDGRLSGVELEDGRVISRAAVFVDLASFPITSWSSHWAVPPTNGGGSSPTPWAAPQCRASG